MSEPKQIRGVIAALLLSRDEDGRPVWRDFDRNAEFVMRTGASGLCVNGATGEYAGATREERKQAVERARRVAGASGLLLSGVGATAWPEILALAHDAEDAGADALLVPAPHFFQYPAGDLAEFYRRIAGEVRVPALLYNLPAFTGSVDTALAARLIRDVHGIVGVKDSSGRLDLIECLAARNGGAIALVGNDSVLADALSRGFCEGVVSGVAGVVPELTLALWRSAQDQAWELFSALDARLGSLLEQLDAFPTPWALKIVAQLRGLGLATFALPLSPERESQVAEFRLWFPEWWNAAQTDLSRALSAEVRLRVS